LDLLSYLYSVYGHAQKPKIKEIIASLLRSNRGLLRKRWIKEKDWSRIDYGVRTVQYNVGGRNEKISAALFFGYDNEFYFSYDRFYIDSKRNNYLTFETDFRKRRETPYAIINDKIVQMHSSNSYALKAYSFGLHYTYRKNYSQFHTLGFFYENRSVSDSILLLNSNYFTVDSENVKYFILKYKFLIDKKDSKIYSEKGLYFELDIVKNSSFNFSKAGINSLEISGKLSYQKPLHKRLILSQNVVLKKTIGKENPFFLNTALGYNHSLRGYEYFAINGSDMFINGSTFNFKILNKRYFELKFIPYEKINKPYAVLYANIFFDSGYVSNHNAEYVEVNNLQNQFLYSYGIGLVFLTYYDKMIRMEYSINKQHRSGIYFHFEAPF